MEGLVVLGGVDPILVVESNLVLVGLEVLQLLEDLQLLIVLKLYYSQEILECIFELLFNNLGSFLIIFCFAPPGLVLELAALLVALLVEG